MQAKARRFAMITTITAIPLVILWAMPTPPAGKTGAPGETSCASCHGGPGGAGSVAVSSTSGMATYTPGATKHFTVTVSGSGNAGFELTARPASNLSGGVAGNLVAGSGTQVLCVVGTACATGNPQYIESTAAVATQATWSFDWAAPPGSENVTLYIAAVNGYPGNTYTASYVLTAAGPPPPTLSVTPASLTFSYQTGGAAPAAQTLSISGVATTYTAVASGGTWLSVSPASGGTSGTANVSVTAAGLAAGTYSGSVTITAAGSTFSPKAVPVTLNVTSSPPTLTVSPTSLTFSYQTGGATPAAQSIAIRGGSLNYTAAASGGTWLSVSPASGTAPGNVSVAVNAIGMVAGAYSGAVTITAPGAVNGTQVVAVNLTVTSSAPSLQITPTTLSFSYGMGTPAPLPYVVSVTSSTTALNYTAASSEADWLSAAPAHGATPGALFISVNPANLGVGTYNGSITITSTDSPSSTQTVPVTLAVTNAGPSACLTHADE